MDPQLHILHFAKILLLKNFFNNTNDIGDLISSIYAVHSIDNRALELFE